MLFWFSFCFIVSIVVPELEAKTVTYPGIGTFHSHDFHDDTHRPFTDMYMPQPPDHMALEFVLFTRDNPHDEEILHWNNTVDIHRSKYFNISLPTKMFIHGFGDNWKSQTGSYMTMLKDRYLEYESVNMMIVDWHKGAGMPYGQATVNTRVVGAMAAIQIEAFIRERGARLDQFHLIGHSLGAHIGGYAGKFLNGTLSRITGLDPAGPYFEHLKPEARLWHTDAQFVDAIHTDSRVLLDKLGLGMMETCAHVDVFPNGGRDQPGCDEDRLEVFLKDINTAFQTLFACSHLRSIQYYADILSHKVEIPKAYECDSYDDYKHGKCTDCGVSGEKCVIIGPRAVEYFNKHRAHLDHGHRYFIATNRHEPYFQWNYLVKIKMAEKGKDHHDQHGKIFIRFNDTEGNVIEQQFGKEQSFHLAHTYTDVLVSRIDPSQLSGQIDFHWNHGIFDLIHSKLYVDSVEITALSSHLSTMNSVPVISKFCSSDAHVNGVDSGKHVHFGKC